MDEKVIVKLNEYLKELEDLKVLNHNEGFNKRDQVVNKIQALLKISFKDYKEKINKLQYSGGIALSTGMSKSEVENVMQNSYHSSLESLKNSIIGFIEELELKRDISNEIDNQNDMPSNSIFNSLNTQPELIIEELKNLKQKCIPLEKLLDGTGELELISLSKKIRSILSTGFKDGEKRVEKFNIEGSNFYKNLQNQISFKSTLSEQNVRYLHNLKWHKMKIDEILDEVRLIQKFSASTLIQKNYEPKNIVTKLIHLISELDDAKKLDVKKVDRHPLLKIQSKYLSILQYVDMDGGKRVEKFEKALKDFIKYEKIYRLGLVKFDMRKKEYELYQKNAEWLERRVSSTLEEMYLLSENPSVEEIGKIFNINEMYEVYRDLNSKLSKACTEVFIIDTYSDISILDRYIEPIPIHVPVKILTNYQTVQFVTASQLLSKKRMLQVHESPTVHDRYIIVDNKAWIIGASLKDAGKKPTSITPINDCTSLYNLWKSIFDSSKVLV